MRNSADGLWVNLRVKEREFVFGAKCSTRLGASRSVRGAADRIAGRNKVRHSVTSGVDPGFRRGDETAGVS